MISTVLTGVVYMAIVWAFVNPDSKWVNIITDVTDSLANLVNAAIKGSL